MRDTYSVLFRENKLMIRSKKQQRTVEYFFNDINTYPNVPFYCNLFQNKIDSKAVSKYIKESFKELQGRILSVKPLVYILMPDDLTDVDKRQMDEFILLALNPKRPILGWESIFITPIEEKNYISIYRSCRMFVLTYVKNKDIKAQKFIENKDYSVEEMKVFIKNIHEDYAYNKLKVYLNGENIHKYSELGKVVSPEELLDNILSLKDMKNK